MKETTNFIVELWAFGDNGKKRREVAVPVVEADAINGESLLNLIFKLGQNDFSPMESTRSVSSGDIIVDHTGTRWLVNSIGFTKLDTAAYERYTKLSGDERQKLTYGNG